MDNINISMLIWYWLSVMLYMDDDQYFNRYFCIPIFTFVVVSRIDPSTRKQTTQKINSVSRICNIILIIYFKNEKRRWIIL